MIELIFNPVTSCVYALAFVGALLFAFWSILDFRERSFFLFIAVVLGFITAPMSWFAATTIMVQPNEKILVINSISGYQDGDLRLTGWNTVPITGAKMYSFPTNTAFQWCPTYSASVQGGLGINAKACMTFNANAVDWKAQFTKYGGGKNEIFTGWTNQTAADVKIAMSKFSQSDLTDKRADVAEAIYTRLKPFFDQQGIVITRVVLDNWDCAVKETCDALEKALLATAKATNEQQAAKIEQQTAVIRAETQAKANTALAESHRKACETAKLEGAACASYIQTLTASAMNDGKTQFVVVFGGNTSPAVVPPPQTQK